MKKLAFALAACTAMTAAVPAVAQTASDTSRLQTAQDRVNRELSIYRQERARTGYGRNVTTRQSAARDRLDRELTNLRVEIDRYQPLVRSTNASGGYNQGSNQGSNSGYSQNNAEDPNYDPSRYYRDGNYEERVLSENDRVYRGNDGQYYCKRNDGTTGLIVGALGGGVLGNVIGGSSGLVGTILGAVGGAIAGRTIERSSQQVRCR